MLLIRLLLVSHLMVEVGGFHTGIADSSVKHIHSDLTGGGKPQILVLLLEQRLLLDQLRLQVFDKLCVFCHPCVGNNLEIRSLCTSTLDLLRKQVDRNLLVGNGQHHALVVLGELLVLVVESLGLLLQPCLRIITFLCVSTNLCTKRVDNDALVGKCALEIRYLFHELHFLSLRDGRGMREGCILLKRPTTDALEFASERTEVCEDREQHEYALLFLRVANKFEIKPVVSDYDGEDKAIELISVLRESPLMLDAFVAREMSLNEVFFNVRIVDLLGF